MEPAGNAPWTGKTGLSQSKGDDVSYHAGDLDDAKYKHQFEARNDYNGGHPALANHYIQPPMEPAGNAPWTGKSGLSQRKDI